MKSGKGTFDRPKFEAHGGNLGAVDVKFNAQGTRLTITSLDFGLSVFGIDAAGNAELLRNMSAGDSAKQYHDIGKIDFNPAAEDELLTGITSLKTLNVKTGTFTREFNKGSKCIQALTYAPSGLLCASGTIEGTVQVFDSNYEPVKQFADHSKGVRALKFSQNS